MNPLQDVYKQAVNMQFKFRDYLDDGGHYLANTLKSDIQRLVDEIEMKKNPRTLEDRVKGIMRRLEEAEGSSMMSLHHIDELLDRCEDMRQALRKFM